MEKGDAEGEKLPEGERRGWGGRKRRELKEKEVEGERDRRNEQRKECWEVLEGGEKEGDTR